ncbi:MAG: HU family DNA-binding protein [Tannerella sp.]|jgi:DNA-binding protein HU-beta|nr:HU family DNA-binding protein [Tannerella sp.]
MNKTDFIAAIADMAGLSKADAKRAMEAVIAITAKELERGGKITLLKFGTFTVVEKAERQGINPRTKQSIIIPRHKIVKFKAGSDLCEAVK